MLPGREITIAGLGIATGPTGLVLVSRIDFREESIELGGECHQDYVFLEDHRCHHLITTKDTIRLTTIFHSKYDYNKLRMRSTNPARSCRL